MGGASSLFIPEPVSPSSPSVSGDELGVCWDCGGRGGMGRVGLGVPSSTVELFGFVRGVRRGVRG